MTSFGVIVGGKEISVSPCALIEDLPLLVKAALGPPTLRVVFDDPSHFHMREGLIEAPSEAGALQSYVIAAITIVIFCNDDKKP